MNTLISQGFVIRGVWEDWEGMKRDIAAEPGSWEHFLAIAPQYLIIVATYEPKVLEGSSWVIG
jgi:hypothetical protein